VQEETAAELVEALREADIPSTDVPSSAVDKARAAVRRAAAAKAAATRAARRAVPKGKARNPANSS
jgi:hypothetical protein